METYSHSLEPILPIGFITSLFINLLCEFLSNFIEMALWSIHELRNSNNVCLYQILCESQQIHYKDHQKILSGFLVNFPQNRFLSWHMFWGWASVSSNMFFPGTYFKVGQVSVQNMLFPWHMFWGLSSVSWKCFSLTHVLKLVKCQLKICFFPWYMF